MTFEMKEERHNWWDTFIKGMTAIVGIITFGWGIWQYGDAARNALAAQKTQSEKDRELRQRELDKPLRELKLKVTLEVLTTVSTLAHQPISSSQWKRASNDYRILFDGKFALVSTPATAPTALKIYNLVNKIESQPDGASTPDTLALTNLTSTFSKAVKAELLKD